jgi:diguanylate cyclase (GGDEF)-like protein
MTHVALTDSLTGLGNHRAFHEDVKAAIQRRNASGGCFSVLMLDLDGLKQINDTLGHQAGDERIKEAGDLLRSVLRETDGAYRTGGDEFMALLPGERAFAALNVAQRLNELAATPGSRISITIGVAEMVGFESKDTLLRQADLALYEGKRSGRKAVVYSHDLGATPPAHGAGTAADRRRPVATALARAVDAKDATTRAHSETVSELCALVAAELGLEAERVASLRLAGLLHDVGKIGIPDAILQKATPLDGAEIDVIQTHALIGESIVAAAGFDEEATWIRHHHERPDGRGYPHGLTAEKIPLESRIIHVADAFEAITAGRSYSPPRSADEALDELDLHAGTQFDPDCVAALHRVIRGGGAAETVEPLVA